MHRRFLSILQATILIFTLSSMPARAQQGQPSSRPEITNLINQAEACYQQGIEAQQSGDYNRMRAQYDAAVDVLLNSGIALTSDQQLQKYYRGLIDKIVTQQLSLRQNEDALAEQRYEGSPSNDILYLTDNDLAQLETKAPAHPQPKSTDYNFQSSTNSNTKNTSNTHQSAELPSSVNQFINYFIAGRGRRTMETGLTRSGRYRQFAEAVFEQYGVPKDLIWLAQVESVWQPVATSHAAARGIWQFMPATGSRFGLNSDGWMDERLDPEKSTIAAAKFLRFLGDHYAGDWLLAMAAYNMGENGLDRAIERAGYADFWVLRERNAIPQETRNYVPAILAVIAIAKQPEAYGLQVNPQPQWQFDKLHIKGSAPLNYIASQLNISADELAGYNPELVNGTTPPSGYHLRVPKGYAEVAVSVPSAASRSSYRTQNVAKKRPRR